jgi:hypothetical protein
LIAQGKRVRHIAADAGHKHHYTPAGRRSSNGCQRLRNGCCKDGYDHYSVQTLTRNIETGADNVICRDVRHMGAHEKLLNKTITLQNEAKVWRGRRYCVKSFVA